MTERKKIDSFILGMIVIAGVTWSAYAFIDTKLVKASDMQQVQQTLQKTQIAIERTNVRIDISILKAERNGLIKSIFDLKRQMSMSDKDRDFLFYLETRIKSIDDELKILQSEMK